MQLKLPAPYSCNKRNGRGKKKKTGEMKSRGYTSGNSHAA